jgi:hypothetical protein
VTSTVQAGPRGRPRSEKARAAILTAAMESVCSTREPPGTHSDHRKRVYTITAGVVDSLIEALTSALRRPGR